jgi:hypothetical protein
MATRMQQRRGTAAQWISTNNGDGPILNAGEIGFESDTNKFKIGDGVNHWVDLNYFVDGAELANIVDGAPALLDTLNELAAAIGDDPAFMTTVATNLSNHQSDTTNIHGITDTAELATKTFAAELLTNATKSNITITGDKNGLTISAENGVADSTTDNLTEGSTNKYFTDERAQDAVGNALGSGLSYDDASGAISVNTTTIQARVADVSDTEIGYLNGVTSAIQTQLNDKAPLASPTFTGTVAGITATMVGLGNVDNTSDANKPVSTATQTALDLKAPLASPTFTGTTTTDDLVVDGDFTVNGTNFAASATSITIEDNLVQIAHNNPANTVDLGIVVGYNDGTAKHAGLVKDTSANTWKLFKGVTTEPATTVDFTEGSLDDLAVAGLTASSLTVGDVSNTEIGYLNGVTSAIQTQIDAKAPLDSPTFTGTVTLPANTISQSMMGDDSVGTNEIGGLAVTTAKIADLNVTEGKIADGAVTSAKIANDTIVNADINSSAAIAQSKIDGLTTDLAAKAPLAGPTFTGTVVLPSTTSIGDVSATEIGYLNNVTSSIQTQLDAKVAKSEYTAKGGILIGTGTGTYVLQSVGTNGQVLAANSAQADGVEWITPSQGAAFSELMLVGC